MKLFSLLLLGALFSLPLKANSLEFVDRHPMAIKGEIETFPSKKANIQKVTEEARSIVMNSPAIASEESTGLSMEGDWHFKMEGLMYDDLTESDWYGMLVGKTFLLESTAKTAYPLIGEFDAATNQLTISKKYVGRDWRGRYFFIEPYTVQNSKLVSAPISAQFDPKTGELKFKADDYLVWIDYEDPEGTKNSYDEGAWYIVESAKRSGDLEKENPDNWTSIGTATIIDGWLSPRFGLEQNLQENWLTAELYQYNKNRKLYRLKNPFADLKIDNYEMLSKTGYIEFDVTDPEHVVFNRIDTGWTCPEIGINKLYCYNILGYYMEEFRMAGENQTVEDFVRFTNPFIPYTTFKDGIVDLTGFLYGGEITYDANFGDANYPTGGNIWIGFNMRSRIYFPDVKVTEPWIDFVGEPSVTYDVESKSAKIDIDFTYENKPENATVFVMVFDKKSGKMVARKYVNASRYDKDYSFVLDGLDADNQYEYVMRVQMEGGLSEILAKSELKNLNFFTDSRELRAADVDGIGNEYDTAVYYNLQGVRIDNPVKGEIYIEVKDGKAVKVIF